MIDLLTNTETGDLHIANNDLVIGRSNEQHQEHLLIAQKGSVKRKPDVGVGIENFLNESDIDEMMREIRFQFEKDGMIVERISFGEQTGDLKYDADYPG
jgi:hypothetical protein